MDYRHSPVYSEGTLLKWCFLSSRTSGYLEAILKQQLPEPDDRGAVEDFLETLTAWRRHLQWIAGSKDNSAILPYDKTEETQFLGDQMWDDHFGLIKLKEQKDWGEMVKEIVAYEQCLGQALAGRFEKLDRGRLKRLADFTLKVADACLGKLGHGNYRRSGDSVAA